MSELTMAARATLGADVQPLDGGFSGETFLVEAAGEAAVIRFYLRQPERAAIDVAVMRLVRGLVPVPDVLDSRTVQNGSGPSFVLTERLPGVRLDQLLADPSTERTMRRRAGAEVGRILARLSGMPFLSAGVFTGPDLGVRALMPGGHGGLEQWVQAHREFGHFADWTGAELAGLLDVAVEAQVLLDTCARVCLCHSDFNPKNLLADPDTGEITGLVDWEYAHAGAPHTDLGNLLRFETDDVFCRMAVRAYAERAPNVRADFIDRARAADLYALVDLAGRADANQITERADALLRTIAVTRDLAGDRPDWL